MPSSVLEIRRKVYEDLVLPSGLTVRYRRVVAQDFLGLGELPVPHVPETEAREAPEESLDTMVRYTHRAIARAVIDPRMTDEVDDGGQPVMSDTLLHVSELYYGLPDDYAALAQAIMVRSGLTSEAASAVEAFRSDAFGTDHRGASGEVPRPADDALSADAGRSVLDHAAGVSQG